ncbi:PREDICTED: ATP synthase mitochondrial F1 complex assembly factor 1-like [Acropora digitifera]|uniref:ATP synthase mitochondrial F1 complex assembly factor 1-like n=1 Tax=Acropora digitifera TaxID=70779 RepID=UPI00077AA7B4|nr:PREDICTED: ATP synthase mitochondrial F1 complex assembly factor 1-like [Acropora digitifera]
MGACLLRGVGTHGLVARFCQLSKFLLGSKPLSSKGETSVYGEKTLASVMHMDKIADKSTEEIRQIWREYHRHKDCISAAIPSNVYNRMEERFLKFPLFIYPLPREQGFEFMYAEFKDHKCYFTSLLHYQTRGENAPWSLAMRHFTDLREKKVIVLRAPTYPTGLLLTHSTPQMKQNPLLTTLPASQKNLFT